MRPAPFVMLALLAGSPLTAQSNPQPTIVLTISAGVVTGHGLWTIDKQPLCVLGAGGACGGVYDTLRIARSISPSLILGASGTYFPSPHLGFHAEISYLDRKSTRLNSSHLGISYAVFCLKKKK